MPTLKTPEGNIEIAMPTAQLGRQLQDLLPFGLCGSNFSPPTFGIVIQCDDKELYCIKQQPVEIERETAELCIHAQSLLIAEAYCRYIKRGYSGAYWATPYMRQRSNELWEAGVAHFMFPSSDGIEAQGVPADDFYDDKFGHGATTMFDNFQKDFAQAFRELSLPPFQYFGLDYRPCSHLQKIGVNFMCVGQNIICLRHDLNEEADKAWKFFAKGGVSQIFHLPSAPVAIKSSDLPVTKGVSSVEY